MIRFDCRLARPDFLFDAAFEAGNGVTALFGPSGSGKTTAIRLLAGLERPERGRIENDGDVLLDTARGLSVPSHRRRIGLVFQDALLLPHLSVRANLDYGARFTPRSAPRIDFGAVVGVLGIGHLLERRPETLSGGERQRVAIGRALLASPRLLLMDEPLASLDAARKLEILPFIERLRDEFGLPILYVSHSLEEVGRLAERVLRFDNGGIVETGPPAAILNAASHGAQSRFDVASILTAHVDSHLADYGLTALVHPAGTIVVPGRIASKSAPVRIAIRATAVTLAVGRTGNVSTRTTLAGHITGIEADAGPVALVTIALAGGDVLRASVTRLALDALGLGPGDHVRALIKTVAIDERGIPGLSVVSGKSV